MSYVAPATGPVARLTAWVARRQYGAAIHESALVYARDLRRGMAFQQFNRAVERRGALPAPLADLAVLRAAQIVGCGFCVDIGSEHARRSGLSDEQLLALHRAADSGLFDADQLLVLEYADALSRTPAERSSRIARSASL